MYLNLGNGKYLRKNRMIGIFDMDTATVSAVTRNYLSRAAREGRVSMADGDIPKSFILVEKRQEKKRKKKKQAEIVLCKLASGVLFGRMAGSRQSTVGEDEI